MSEYGAPVPLLARYAVMVDVGYIFAAAGELLLGTSSRRDFRVDAVPLISAISKHADELVRGELLRVYWYDAARDRVPTIDQRVIAQLPFVKLRLGHPNGRGPQQWRGPRTWCPRSRRPRPTGSGSTCGASTRPTAPTRPNGWSGSPTRWKSSTPRSSARTSPASRRPVATTRRPAPCRPRRSCSATGSRRGRRSSPRP